MLYYFYAPLLYLKEKMTITNITTTQTVHPWKTSFRTMIQVGTAALPVLAFVLTVLQQELGAYLPEAFSLWAVSAYGFLIALSGALTLIMANSQVNELLTKIGLGATPKHVVQAAVLESNTHDQAVISEEAYLYQGN